jgi:DNA-binding response OmpR family regulator/GTPase SAR1 family protein
VAIEENEIESLGNSKDFLFEKNSFSSSEDFKVLVISENSSEIFMVKKLLSKSEGFVVHEAATLSAALKVVNYLKLDLIIVDDRLSGLDGYDVVEKFNHIEMTKDIPKLILMTADYKVEKRRSLNAKSDFVTKPLDGLLFKLRVKSLLERVDKNSAYEGYFTTRSLKYFKEAQHAMYLYHDIFQSDENIMMIYDAKRGEVVESNAIFEKFFLPIPAFNRILKNPKLARKFVPFVDEVNYLNYYHPDAWMETIILGREFHYQLKLHRDFKEYSFTISVKRVSNNMEDIYLVKLSNIYDYLPQKESVKKEEMKLSLKEKNLSDFKEEFLTLRNLLWQQNMKSEKIDKVLYTLSTKLSILCEDASIIDEDAQSREINLYFLLVRLLKEKFLNRNIYLNGERIDLAFDEHREELYVDLKADAVIDLVFGLLNNYYGNYFNTSMQHKRLDISLHRDQDSVMIDMKLDRVDVQDSSFSLIDKIFHKNSESLDSSVTDALPKNVKQALLTLNGHIKKVEEGDKSIFTLYIPIEKES